MFAVHLAIEEALVNAIKHGNRKDPAKTVEVVCRISKNGCRWQPQQRRIGLIPHMFE